MSADPFAALGLPVRNDLTSEQIRAAWRQIAAATHPDRPDGGDIARGRPLRLALRGIAAAIMSAVVMQLIGGQPAGPAVVTGIITWFVLTGRGDLAAPPGR